MLADSTLLPRNGLLSRPAAAAVPLAPHVTAGPGRLLLHPAAFERRHLAAGEERSGEAALDVLGRLQRIWQEARLLGAAVPTRAVSLGGARDPYADEADAALSHAVLTELRQREGYVVTITTASPRVLADLDLLAQLDQQHAVRIDYRLSPAAPPRWRLASLAPEALEVRSQLHTVARLAAEGLTTRLILSPRGPARGLGAAFLEPWLAAADEAGVVDVLADASAFGPWLATFERLRLEAGFPRSRPGRG